MTCPTPKFGQEFRAIFTWIASIGIVFTLSGCGLIQHWQEIVPTPKNQTPTPTPTTFKPSATPLEPDTPQPSSPSETPTETALPEREPTPPPEGAYADVGRERPAESEEFRTFAEATEPIAIFVMPSGNIGCEISNGTDGTTLRCEVKNWHEDGTVKPSPYDDQIGGRPTFVILPDGSEPTYGGNKTDCYSFEEGCVPDAPKAQTLEYGQVAYYNDMVCASDEAGLTCWNIKTGVGSFINRSGHKDFKV